MRAPVVVLSAGLGGGGSYWLPQRRRWNRYQVVSYDHNGTGKTPTPCRKATAWRDGGGAGPGAGGGRDRPLRVVGHALGALIGLQLALDAPTPRRAGVVNGWLTLSPIPAAAFRSASVCCMPAARRRGSKRSRCFSTRRTGWPPAPPPGGRRCAGAGHFQGKRTCCTGCSALKQADFSRHAARIRCPTLIICAADDMLVPAVCSSELQAAIPQPQRGDAPGRPCLQRHRADTFNTLLLNGLASLLHSPEPAL
jgi:aminoacrylate hydrolase